MKSILLCLMLVLAVVAADNTWERYKSTYGKKYSSEQDKNRQARFAQTTAAIEAHNKRYAAGLETYSQAHNQFSDMSAEEKAAYLGLRQGGIFTPKESGSPEATFNATFDARAIPTSYDLRSSKCMPAIKNQGKCGNCWAFASVTPIEYQFCVKKNRNVLVTLSEQQITDCSYTASYDGCQGGNHNAAWSHVYKSGGLQGSSGYPYVSGNTGTDTTCKFTASKAVAKLGNAGTSISRDETAIQNALVNYGPIAFAFHVSNSFYSYKSGVFSDTSCKTDSNSLNHAMVLVGYGVSGSTPYWIVRNTWGTGWGQAGYVFIRRGKNTCGIAMNAGYPTVI